MTKKFLTEIDVPELVSGNLSISPSGITSTQASDDILITPTGIGALKIENRITLENILSFGPLDPQGSYMAVNAEYLQSGPLSAWQYLQNGIAIKYEFANDGALTVFTAPAGLAGDFILSWTQVFQIPNSGIIAGAYGGTGTANANSTLAITGNATISGSNTGDQIITLTGDVTGSGTGNFATILANTTVTAGTYGNSTQAAQVAVDAKGRITTATNVTITPAFSDITNKPTTVIGYGITDGVTLDGQQTLTNKTVTDSTFTIQDEVDNSKKAKFQLSNLTSLTTRTYTLPNVNGILVTTNDAGSVSNAMLAGSIADTKLNTITTAGKVSNSATTATSGNTASAIVARDTSGNFSANAIEVTQVKKTGGTSSQFLKADGSVDSTAYLPSTSYTAADVLSKLLTVDGAGSGLDADLVDGLPLADAATNFGPVFPSIPLIKSGAGVMEIGRYLDFHNTSGDSIDYSVRLDTGGTTTGLRINGIQIVTAGNVGTYALPITGGTVTGQLISTKVNDTSNGGGQIYLNGTTGNRIDFSTNGVSNPALTTRSVGTKIVLYPAISASATDYALGIASNAMWLTVPSSSSKFSFYSATTEIFTVNGAGDVVQKGGVFFNQPTPTLKSAAAVLTAAELQSQIIRFTGTGATLTYPTGTTIDEGLPAEKIDNTAFNFSVINTGTGTVTLAANDGVTLVGNHTIIKDASAIFRIRRTAANTFVSYRIS